MLSFGCCLVGIGEDRPKGPVTKREDFLKVLTAREKGAVEITTNRPVSSSRVNDEACWLLADEGSNEDVELLISDAILTENPLSKEQIHFFVDEELSGGPELILEFGTRLNPLLGVYLSPTDAILFLKTVIAANPEALIQRLEELAEEEA